MNTKRCAYCHKLSRADAVTCSRCGQSFAEKTSSSPTRSSATSAGSKGNAVEEKAALRTRRRTILPASPHRAGHYSGLHPEDQPYQSTMLAVQRPPESQAHPQVQKDPAIKYLPDAPDPLPDDSALSSWSTAASRPTEVQTQIYGRPAPEAYMHPLNDRMKAWVRQSGSPFWRGRYVPAVLTISCLIFLVASSLLAYVLINKKPAPPPGLAIAPVSLTYSGTTQQNPGDQVITLQNTSGQTLNWSSSVVTGDGAAWLSINPTSDHLAAHSRETITASVRSQQLAIGSYQGTINFKGGTNPSVTVALSVTASGNVVASKPSLSFVSAGQNPAAQTVTIQNRDGGPLDWWVTTYTVDGANWLNAAPASGHLEMNQVANVAISINVATLKPQTYQGTVTFTYGVRGQTVQIPVSLSVSIPTAPAISLDQGVLNFSTPLGANPSPQSFSMRNTGNATLNWVITEDQNGATFAPVSSTSGSLAPAQSTTITVTPTVAQASVGTLTTNITIADSDAGSKVAKQRITVNIVVKG